MESTAVVPNAIFHELLTYNNYKYWSLRVKTYFLAEDLWDVVKPSTETPQPEPKDGEEYKAWTRKNAKALHVIQSSCGNDMFSFISEISTAKSAWEALENECKTATALVSKKKEAEKSVPTATDKGHSSELKESGPNEELEIKEGENNAKDFEPYIPFTGYVIDGDWDNAKKCLTELPDAIRVIDPRDGYGDRALHVAAREGHVEIVRELVLLMKQEQLEVKNAFGCTALEEAVSKGHVDVVKELVQGMRQEGLAIKTTDGSTVLHLAVSEGYSNIVKELVLSMRQENLKIKNNDGYTALHLAVKMGNVPVLKELLPNEEAGENDAMDDFQRYIPFTKYVISGDWDKAKECLEELDDPYTAITIVDPRDGEGDTALHAATKEGHVHIVKELLKMMKARQEESEQKASEAVTAIDSEVDADLDEGVLIERAKNMVEKYDKTLANILEVKNAKGSIALHLAIMGGHMNIVKELLPLMRQEAWEVKDGEGYTALGCALDVRPDGDVMEMAQYMAEKTNKVFCISMPKDNRIPVVWAFGWSKWKLGRYLYSLTPLEALNGPQGADLICYCIYTGKELDVAWDLLQRFPRLAVDIDNHPMLLLARMHYAFLSGTQLKFFWEKWIYNCIHIQLVDSNIHDTTITVSKSEDDQVNQWNLICSVMSLFRRLVKCLLEVLGINRIYEIKSTHVRIFQFVRCMGELTRNEDLTLSELDIVKKSIFKAIEQGHIEFVTQICKANPKLVDVFDEKERSIFHFAIECRQEEIYSLIYGLEKEKGNKKKLLVAKFNNNLLHSAGNLSALPRFTHIHGAGLQMQRELQWFKEVESIVPPEMHEFLNFSDDLTPRELFTKNHKKLMEEGEISMKGTATSCTVVGALIVTIMFAVAFTVPGGLDSSTGLPMFIHKQLFRVFIVSDTISLVSSSTSVIIFLGILTSRYAEDDFLKNLPTKMMIALFTLFLSIVTMMIAFSSALIMMFDGESWSIIPSILLASIPVASFVWMQFPLLVGTFISTYGPGIFNRKVKRWY